MLSKRILLLAATTGYQTRAFAEAAQRLGLDLILATDRCHVLDDPWGDRAVPVRFEEPEAAAMLLAQLSPQPQAIVALGDRPTGIAALAAARLGIAYNSFESVQTCRNKHRAREGLRAAGLPAPDFFQIPLESLPEEWRRRATYPCVLKPLGLSGSRGVIRANNQNEFSDAFHRIRALLLGPEILRLHEGLDRFIQVETFIPGREYALEGLLRDGELQVLAVFDKPDPLDGPYFEETLYITAADVPQNLVDATERAIQALGLTQGPVHAEMRVSPDGTTVWILEVAARPIGGLCSKALKFQDGVSLEELVLRHAIGEDVRGIRREASAAGVMMIPIPNSGVYAGVTGTEDAARIHAIEEVIITAKVGQRLLQLPEGNSYLGFLFARAESPQAVEIALRSAHAKLRFEIVTELPVLSGRAN
ncbi:MAG TPA: ATP-grasp domain-containing protein [Bryobacteraceae bacterium]|nr:ATP-grasp domain-containing protein [Bryobacteraceae bacterium]